MTAAVERHRHVPCPHVGARLRGRAHVLDGGEMAMFVAIYIYTVCDIYISCAALVVGWSRHKRARLVGAFVWGGREYHVGVPASKQGPFD